MIILSMLRTLLEADEIDMRKIGPEKTEVVMITSGIKPGLAEIKSKIFKALGVPMKIMDVKEIEPLQEGYVMKRYKITGVIESGIEETERKLVSMVKNREMLENRNLSIR